MTDQPETRRVVDALLQLGWQIEFVTDPALTVEGRELPVARVKATRPGRDTRAMIVLFADSVAETMARLEAPSSTTANGALPGSPWSLRAEVDDARAALAVGQCVAEIVRGDDASLEACVRGLEAAGWTIDHKDELVLDELQWEIRGSRDSERLDLGILFRGDYSLEETALRVEIVFDSLHVATRYKSAWGRVRSCALAQDLVDALRRVLSTE